MADGTIYLYFQDKQDILVRLFDEVMSEHVGQAREAVRSLPSAPERLRAIAERHLTVLGENRDLAVVFHSAADAEVLRREGGRARVEFAEPQRAVTPGQSAVFYDGDVVVGGGIVAEAARNEPSEG